MGGSCGCFGWSCGCLGRSCWRATADSCESYSGPHSKTTTTVGGVVQRVDFGLNPCLPISDRESIEAHELRIGSRELDEIPDWRIGRTVERIVALPEGSEI